MISRYWQKFSKLFTRLALRLNTLARQQYQIVVAVIFTILKYTLSKISTFFVDTASFFIIWANLVETRSQPFAGKNKTKNVRFKMIKWRMFRNSSFFSPLINLTLNWAYFLAVNPRW